MRLLDSQISIPDTQSIFSITPRKSTPFAGGRRSHRSANGTSPIPTAYPIHRIHNDHTDKVTRRIESIAFCVDHLLGALLLMNCSGSPTSCTVKNIGDFSGASVSICAAPYQPVYLPVALYRVWRKDFLDNRVMIAFVICATTPK